MKGLTIAGISEMALNKGIEMTDYHEDPVKQEASVEGITAHGYEYRKRSANRFMKDVEDGYVDCGEGNGRARRPLMYSKKQLSSTSSLWTFHLNSDMLSFGMINDFVNKMLLVKESDAVLIHGPSAVYIDDAEVVYSAIKRCKSQKIVISSPYILNTPAAYLLTAANKIVNSPAGVIHMDAGFVGGCGKPTDAMNGMQCEVFRVKRILEVLKNNGFLDDKDIDYIMINQGQICKHGRELATIIEKYNEAHK